jgi:hypothetical protein
MELRYNSGHGLQTDRVREKNVGTECGWEIRFRKMFELEIEKLHSMLLI